MLFCIWSPDPYRPTRDLDLLGWGEPDPTAFARVIREVCEVACPEDGLTFDLEGITAERIREAADYQGVRVKLRAHLGATRIPLTIDIGVGDDADVEDASFPTLLGMPEPKIRAYRREAVVAEKYQAMVALGIADSRMKDFYDVWLLASEFAFDGQSLADALAATFGRRNTILPVALPLALSPEFCQAPGKAAQWRAFCARQNPVGAPGTLDQAIPLLVGFLMPPSAAAAKALPFAAAWPPRGPWHAS